MATYADPGFKLHTSMGQYITLLVYHLANDEIIPFDVVNAASVLRDYYAELEDSIESAGVNLDTTAITDALDTFEQRAKNIRQVADYALSFNDSVIVDVVNTKYKDFQRGFVSQGGLPRRPTFKHVLMAPGIDNGKMV
jgi:N-acetylated-alpha-linked acidic dipeptidase